jgi:cytidylate kinase
LHFDIRSSRKSGARGVEELQRTIIEIETKFKSEITRYKKKYETDLRELELQNENLNRANAELAKANKSLANRVKVSLYFYAGQPLRVKW